MSLLLKFRHPGCRARRMWHELRRHHRALRILNREGCTIGRRSSRTPRLGPRFAGRRRRRNREVQRRKDSALVWRRARRDGTHHLALHCIFREPWPGSRWRLASAGAGASAMACSLEEEAGHLTPSLGVEVLLPCLPEEARLEYPEEVAAPGRCRGHRGCHAAPTSIKDIESDRALCCHRRTGASPGAP